MSHFSTFDDLIFYHKSNLHFANKIIKKQTTIKQETNQIPKQISKLDQIKRIQAMKEGIKQNKKSERV